LLKKCLESGNIKPETSFINKWVKKFGIGDSITFHADSEGLGVQIRLHKTPEDKDGRLLADEGYGITQLLSIMLQIEMSGKSETTIAVEEPEIHLHPKYQSLLADMFVDAYKTLGQHFIIETHSEYLIRRLQLLVAGIDTDAEKELDKNDVSIAYIYTKEEAEKENQPRVKNIAICEDGYLDDTFGTGFFDEATKLSRKLM
jgi:predicted ATPase